MSVRRPPQLGRDRREPPEQLKQPDLGMCGKIPAAPPWRHNGQAPKWTRRQASAEPRWTTGTSTACTASTFARAARRRLRRSGRVHRLGQRTTVHRRSQRARRSPQTGRPDGIEAADLRPCRSFKAVARVRIPLGALQYRKAHQVVLGPVAQLVRAPPCHGGGRRFKSGRGRQASLWNLSRITLVPEICELRPKPSSA